MRLVVVPEIGKQFLRERDSANRVFEGISFTMAVGKETGIENAIPIPVIGKGPSGLNGDSFNLLFGAVS